MGGGGPEAAPAWGEESQAVKGSPGQLLPCGNLAASISSAEGGACPRLQALRAGAGPCTLLLPGEGLGSQEEG